MSTDNQPKSEPWIRTGLWALPGYAALTAWSTLTPQPDQVTDPEGWALFVTTTRYLVSHLVGSTGGLVLAVFGLFALGARLAGGRAGRLGLAAMTITVAGQLLLMVPAVLSTFVTPALGQAYLAGHPDVMAVQFPSAMTATFAMGLLLAVVGNLLVAAAIWRDDRLPRWAGVLWAASATVFYLLGVVLGMATTGASLPTQPIGALLLVVSGSWIAWQPVPSGNASGVSADGSSDQRRAGGTLMRAAQVHGGPSARAARRGLAIYFTVVVLLSAPLQAGIILTHAFDDTALSILWLTGLMFVPALASITARLILRDGFTDVSFRLGGRRVRLAVLRAGVFPVAVAVIVYGVAWGTGLAAFRPEPLNQWLTVLAVMVVVNIVLSFGEELGWRGYMVTRLVAAGAPAPLLASGLIWGTWHVPLFLWGGFVADSPSPAFSTLMLMVLTGGLGYILARTRIDTGSVWPAVALHVAWNVTIQTGFDPLTGGAGRAVWVGETGILTVTVVAAAAVIHARAVRNRPASNSPQPDQSNGVAEAETDPTTGRLAAYGSPTR